MRLRLEQSEVPKPVEGVAVADAPKNDAPCALCRSPIGSYYFIANGEVLCAACRDGVLAVSERSLGIEAFVTATFVSFAAVAAGAGAHYAVAKFAGINFLATPVVIGLLTGLAARSGSLRQGGARYQLLALVLTYLTIACIYAPSLSDSIFGEDGFVSPKRALVFLERPLFLAHAHPYGLAFAVFGLFVAWFVPRRRHVDVTGPFLSGFTRGA